MTKIQAKIASMTVEQAVKWIRDHYYGNDEFIVITFHGAEASAPILINNKPTQWQVAHFRHSSYAAANKLGREHEVDTVYVVGSYYHDGEWSTSVEKYSR